MPPGDHKVRSRGRHSVTQSGRWRQPSIVGSLPVAGKSILGRWNSFGGRLRVESCWRVGGRRKSHTAADRHPKLRKGELRGEMEIKERTK